MNAADLFGIGGAWTREWKTQQESSDWRSPAIGTPISAEGVKINTAETDAAAVQGIRDRLRTAATSLQDALSAFTRETKPVYASTGGNGPRVASLSGLSARVDPTPVQYQVLAATRTVNSNTSTVQQSSAAIGLDTTSAQAASRLSSSAGLGLDLTSPQSASTIQSTGEMNSGYKTAYGSSSLTFTNGAGNTSTSSGTLTGTYKGVGAAANATSLTIEQMVTSNPGILFSTNVQFQVRDQDGTVLFNYSGNLVAGQQVYLGDDIGLSVSFSAGQLKKNHTAATTVSKTPITVDGNAAFNAGAAARPKFENGATVTAGSFTINGTSIGVNAGDTINTVLSKINGSAAGVTATLGGDKISLTTNGNSEDAIVLANDTSGFLAATKLAGATTATGNVRDDQQVLAKTSQFGGVSSGSFTINGVAIAVDRNADTVSSVIGKINGAGAGVTASFNSATNRIELVTTASSEDQIVVGNDATGFLTAAKLSTANTVRGNVRDDQQVLAKTAQFAGVATGAFSVNGVSIAVNRDADSLASVLAKVNASAAGVTATYDSAADKVTFTPNVLGDTLTLGDDTSGFLSAANISVGSIAATANPDAAFNGTGAGGPNLDGGLSVRAGAFSVNGVTIDVAADDSINSVLAKITASAAGVTASYDAATDMVMLKAKQSGTAAVTVGTDSSGFLNAVKLDSTAINTTNPAMVSSLGLAMNQMTEYAGVTTGTLTVNGHGIAIDPAFTTVLDLVSTIDAVAGVSATVNAETGSIQIWSETAGGSLTLADTSGALAALGIAPGTYSGGSGSGRTTTIKTGTVTTTNAAAVASDVDAALTQLNDVVSTLMNDHENDAAFGGDLEEALVSAVEMLRDQGFRGLSVTRDDEGLRVAMTRDSLVNALNGLDDDLDIARAIGSLADTLDADFAAAGGWGEKAPATVQALRLDSSRVQLAADQTATSLLLFKSSLDSREPDEMANATKAMKAYSKG